MLAPFLCPPLCPTTLSFGFVPLLERCLWDVLPLLFDMLPAMLRSLLPVRS